jgi:hypothetical protein
MIVPKNMVTERLPYLTFAIPALDLGCSAKYYKTDLREFICECIAANIDCPLEVEITTKK